MTKFRVRNKCTLSTMVCIPFEPIFRVFQSVYHCFQCLTTGLEPIPTGDSKILSIGESQTDNCRHKSSYLSNSFKKQTLQKLTKPFNRLIKKEYNSDTVIRSLTIAYNFGFNIDSLIGSLHSKNKLLA